MHPRPLSQRPRPLQGGVLQALPNDPDDEAGRVERLPGDDPEFRKPVGCNRCVDTDYRGRVGIYELMMVTDKIREMIARRASTGEIANAAQGDGMMRLKDDGLHKAARGLISIEEVLRTVV